MTTNRTPPPSTPSRVPAPSPGHPGAPVTVYYRANGVLVTARHLSVHGQRYDVAGLSGLMYTRGSPHPGVMASVIIAIVEAGVLVPLVGAVRSAPLAVLTVFALGVPCVVAFVCARRWPPRYELVATYRGREVTLLDTRDEREFGRISRALRRSVEAGVTGRYV